MKSNMKDLFSDVLKTSVKGEGEGGGLSGEYYKLSVIFYYNVQY